MQGFLPVSLSVCMCVFVWGPINGFVIWLVSKAAQCENHLHKVREMWCGSALIINSHDNWGRNPSFGGEMGLHEDEAAIKAWMKRCKTIRPERIGGGGGDPGEQAVDGDGEIGGEEENERRGGWVSHVCSPSKAVSVTHYCQAASLHRPCCPPPLLHSSLLSSHINSTSFNCPPGVSSTECQPCVRGDGRLNKGRTERVQAWREEEGCFACSETIPILSSDPDWPASFHFNCTLFNIVPVSLTGV